MFNKETYEQSVKIDRLQTEYYKSKNDAIKEELRAEQELLDKMVLGRKLKQDEINQLIEGGYIK